MHVRSPLAIRTFFQVMVDVAAAFFAKRSVEEKVENSFYIVTTHRRAFLKKSDDTRRNSTGLFDFEFLFFFFFFLFVLELELFFFLIGAGEENCFFVLFGLSDFSLFFRRFFLLALLDVGRQGDTFYCRLDGLTIAALNLGFLPERDREVRASGCQRSASRLPSFSGRRNISVVKMRQLASSTDSLPH